MNKNIILKATIVFLFAVIWITSLVFVLLIPQYKMSYQHPHIKVQLLDHIYGLKRVDDTEFELIMVNDVYVSERRNGMVVLSNDYLAYVNLDDSLIVDTFSNEHQYFSKGKLDDLLQKYCSDNVEDIRLEDVPEPTYGIMPENFTVNVTGRYEGVLAFTTSRLLPEEATNIVQAWKISEHLPWSTICIIFITAIIIGVIAYSIISSSKNKTLSTLGIIFSMTIIILLIFVYAQRMK